MLFSILISAGLLYADRPAGYADQPSDTLHAVTITADKGVIVSRTDTIHLRNSSYITSDLHQIPGLQVGDYGGFAGLKTISLRGMGSPHTAVYVDGVKVGNVQTGQGDLGMLEIENYSSAVIDYAQNSITFNTERPEFSDSPIASKIRFDMESFGTYLPSARIDMKLGENLALSANAAGVISEGDFPISDGTKRTNNDIRQVRGSINLFGNMNEGDYLVKAFCNAAERGTPGSITWPSEDRQKDINLFLQTVVKNRFSEFYTLNISGKAAYDRISYMSSWGDNRYDQTELQANSSHLFRINRWWNVSLATDIHWDRLTSDNYSASRITTFSSISNSFRYDRLSLNISVEYSGYHDKEQKSRNVISPSMNFRIYLIEGLYVVGFGRRAYRMPMFNELYYVGYGNPDLKPEEDWLSDIGLDLYRSISPSWKVKARIDGHYNRLTNKITSAPTAEDPNIWLPYNIGKVRSTGADIVTGTYYESRHFKGSINLSYSFQSAIDKTKDSSSYGLQIPYIAKHTISTDLRATWKGYTINPRWLLKTGRTDGTGSLADWNTLDLTVSKTIAFRKSSTLTINLSARNLLDKRYELTSGYPMPGRTFIISLVSCR